MIFIDTPNLQSSGIRVGVPLLNFQELMSILAGDQRPVGCNCYVPDREDRQAFYGQLERMGLHVNRVSPGKSVDGRLIFDMLDGAITNRYDIATLCSGDGDYIRVVERVKQMGKTVWIATFSGSVSAGLGAAADKLIKLDDVIDRIRMERRQAV